MMKMTEARWQELMSESFETSLTADELAQGWHFCNEFDGLLADPQSSELEFCRCLPKGHPVYTTFKPLDEL